VSTALLCISVQAERIQSICTKLTRLRTRPEDDRHPRSLRVPCLSLFPSLARPFLPLPRLLPARAHFFGKSLATFSPSGRLPLSVPVVRLRSSWGSNDPVSFPFPALFFRFLSPVLCPRCNTQCSYICSTQAVSSPSLMVQLPSPAPGSQPPPQPSSAVAGSPVFSHAQNGSLSAPAPQISSPVQSSMLYDPLEAARARRRVPPEKRKRTAISCDACKRKRSKCMRNSANETCAACAKAQIPCESLAPRKVRVHSSFEVVRPDSASPSTREEGMDMLLQAVYAGGIPPKSNQPNASPVGPSPGPSLAAPSSSAASWPPFPSPSRPSSSLPLDRHRPRSSLGKAPRDPHPRQATGSSSNSQRGSDSEQLVQQDALGRARYIGPSGSLYFFSQLRELVSRHDARAEFVRDGLVRALDSLDENEAGDKGAPRGLSSPRVQRLAIEDLPPRRFVCVASVTIPRLLTNCSSIELPTLSSKPFLIMCTETSLSFIALAFSGATRLFGNRRLRLKGRMITKHGFAASQWS
jgi:hypothetical protein